MNYYFVFVKKPAMKWQMVFNLPSSQRQIKYYTLLVLCDLSEAGGEYKLIYLHSKARTISIAEGLMD